MAFPTYHWPYTMGLQEDEAAWGAEVNNDDAQTIHRILDE